jgi:hypothetical protein
MGFLKRGRIRRAIGIDYCGKGFLLAGAEQ